MEDRPSPFHSTPAAPEGAVNDRGQTPNEHQPSSSPQGEPRAPMGPIIATIVVVGVLAVGGLYYWGSKVNERAEQASTLEFPPAGEAPSPEELEKVSTSTDLSTIEQELNFDVEALDAELQPLDQELQL